jgi:hypothetical protein
MRAHRDTVGPDRGAQGQFRRLRSGSPALLLLALIPLVLAGCGSSVATPAPTAPAPTAPATATATDLTTPTTTPWPAFTPWDTPTPDPTAAPTPTPAPAIWTLNVYDAHGFRYQNPDLTACTAASAQIMLNMATIWSDYQSLAPGKAAPTKPRGWKVDVSKTLMETLLAYQRKYGTMILTDPGADAHGWRDALNFYGWGSMTANVYKDLTYTSFADAARATVMAVALYRKPVGILAWAGDHAQVVTGYRVKGQDPRTGSTSFAILGVYLSDPLRSDGYLNSYIPLATWSGGAKHIRFTPYTMTNSPYVDSLDHKQGNAEWDGKWVIVAPVA